MIVAQRDYVRRDQPAAPLRRKKSDSREKQRSLFAVYPAQATIATAVLIAFISSLYFITHNHNKKEDAETLPSKKMTRFSLPPQPEERWRYINELESRQLGVRTLTAGPSADREVKKTIDQLANTRSQLPQLIVPWQKLKQHQQQAQQQMQQPKPQPAASITRAVAPKQTATKKKDQSRWMIQCGSFKGVDQAETVRTQLEFEGFNSSITINNGWNRVVIGPIDSKENLDSTINRLKLVGHSSCVRLAYRG